MRVYFLLTLIVLTKFVNCQIQAESYTNVKGSVVIEGCSEGGYNVTDFNNQEYLEYPVRIFVPGIKTVLFRIACPSNNAQGRLYIDGRVKYFNIINTGGDQVWNSVQVQTNYLDTGLYVFRIMNGYSPAWNFNWFEVLGNDEPIVLPTADAGNDTTVSFPILRTVLNGKGTGKNITKKWELVKTDLLINYDTTDNPLIKFFNGEKYTFRLTVTDEKGNTATDDVEVTMTYNPLDVMGFFYIDSGEERQKFLILNNGVIAIGL